METVRVAACRAVARTEFGQGEPSELGPQLPLGLVDKSGETPVSRAHAGWPEEPGLEYMHSGPPLTVSEQTAATC